MSNDGQNGSGSQDGVLTASQIETFQRDGYLVIPGFFDPAPLLERSKHLVSSFSLDEHPLTKFITSDQEKGQEAHIGDKYFLESGDQIRFFLEEGAVAQDHETKVPQLTVPKAQAVNKVGHGLHIQDPVFKAFSFNEKIRNVARSINAHKQPKVLQSMIICKQPSIGGQVPAHNDSTFLYTDPPSAIGFWFALEDCTSSNGCLSFYPGSHRYPPATQSEFETTSAAKTARPRDTPSNISKYGVPRGINQRFVRKDPTDSSAGTTFLNLEQDEELSWDESKSRMEECKAGSLVLIHGSVLHKSEKNLSKNSRFIYTFHMIEGDTSLARYDERNWLQPPKGSSFTDLYDPQ